MVATNHLKKGSWYIFDHKRKGKFFARFLSEELNGGDLSNPILLNVEVWTQAGSGQERLANSMAFLNGVKQQPIFSPKKLLPSLLNSIDTPNTVTQERLNGMSFEPSKGAEYSGAKTVELPVLPEPETKRRWWQRGKS